jgi:hypothetical protein
MPLGVLEELARRVQLRQRSSSLFGSNNFQRKRGQIWRPEDLSMTTSLHH